jgi:hypothetical protein
LRTGDPARRLSAVERAAAFAAPWGHGRIRRQLIVRIVRIVRCHDELALFSGWVFPISIMRDRT